MIMTLHTPLHLKILPDLLPSPYSPTSCPLFFGIKFSISSNLFCQCAEYAAISWSMVYLPGANSLTKTNYPFPRRH